MLDYASFSKQTLTLRFPFIARYNLLFKTKKREALGPVLAFFTSTETLAARRARYIHTYYNNNVKNRYLTQAALLLNATLN